MKQAMLHTFSQKLRTAIPEIQAILVSNTVGVLLLGAPDFGDEGADELAATTAALCQFGRQTAKQAIADPYEYVEVRVGGSCYVVLVLGESMILGVLLPHDFPRERLLQTVKEVLDTAVA